MCFVSSLHQIHLEHLRQSANPKEISTGALDVAMFTLCKTKSLFPRQIWVGKIFRFSSKTIFVHVENCHASLCWSLYRQTDMLMQLTCLAVFSARIGEASEGESPGSAVAMWNCGVSGNLWSVQKKCPVGYFLSCFLNPRKERVCLKGFTNFTTEYLGCGPFPVTVANKGL